MSELKLTITQTEEGYTVITEGEATKTEIEKCIVSLSRILAELFEKDTGNTIGPYIPLFHVLQVEFGITPEIAQIILS